MYVHHFATIHPKEHTMHLLPVHYGPHHNGHMPLCGAEPVGPGQRNAVIVTMLRDSTTCFRCIDMYEERAATPEQRKALAEARDAIDEAMRDIEEQLAFDEGKRVTLMALEHMLEGHTPWWQVRRQFRLRRAIGDLRALKLEDLKP